VYNLACDSKNLTLEQCLVKKKLLSAHYLEIALKEKQRTNTSLRDVLLRLRLVSESTILQLLHKQFNFNIFDRSKFALPKDKLSLPQAKAYELRVLPFFYDELNHVLSVVFVDPLDVRALDLVRQYYPHPITIDPHVACERDVLSAIDHAYARQIPHEDQPGYGFCEDDQPFTYERASQQRDGASVEKEKVLQTLLEEAVKAGASDVHFEPHEAYVTVRMRRYGRLENQSVFHKEQWGECLSRLKVLAEMDIAERRLPQTGRFSQMIAGREIDFRCSSHPTQWGENFVIRILDRLHAVFELEELGFLPGQVQEMKRQLERPYGMIIISGPTGSGKTTTLYSMVSHLNARELNIMTLEDPIEYDLPHIRQTQINPQAGLTFAAGIRSILRQDPDVILIGEIRDEDTARMALRAAMTGHLVLTTVHTNSALQIPGRLRDLGIDPALLSGNLNCLLSQRLVKVTAQQTHQLGRRVPIAEIVPVDAQLDRLIAEGKAYQELLNTIGQQDVLTLRHHATELIKNNIVCESEIKRVMIYEG
jgi:Type II secretory pathway, ATPase PulE/Tfp pilus assembly pathway, ATPase PilB